MSQGWYHPNLKVFVHKLVQLWFRDDPYSMDHTHFTLLVFSLSSVEHMYYESKSGTVLEKVQVEWIVGLQSFENQQFRNLDYLIRFKLETYSM